MDISQLKKPLEEKLHQMGFTLFSLTNVKEEGQNVLKIVVDRPQPIDLNTIVSLTQNLDQFLDDIITDSSPYVLDISSAGAEKPLTVENLGLYLHQFLHLHLHHPIDGDNIFEGYLEKADEESIEISIKIKTRTKIIHIEKSNIAKVRLAIKF